MLISIACNQETKTNLDFVLSLSHSTLHPINLKAGLKMENSHAERCSRGPAIHSFPAVLECGGGGDKD